MANNIGGKETKIQSKWKWTVLTKDNEGSIWEGKKLRFVPDPRPGTFYFCGCYSHISKPM